jgi:hypothetical protein
MSFSLHGIRHFGVEMTNGCEKSEAAQGLEDIEFAPGSLESMPSSHAHVQAGTYMH